LQKFKLLEKELHTKLNINYPIRKNKYELTNLNELKKNNSNMKTIKDNIIDYKYVLINYNLFNFDEIIKFSQEYNNNVNYINFKIFWKLSRIPDNARKYTIYILINLLYLIFCMQLKGGSLTITYLLTPDNAFLDYLYILNNYYDEVKLTNREIRGITIHCNNFRGISKSELNDFFKKYKIIYDENIKSNLDILFPIIKKNSISNKNKDKEEEVINIKYVDRLISNNINNKFINSYKNYNIEVNNFIIFMDKYISKINDLYDNSKSNKIKKYIFLKIFQEQYITYFILNTKLNNQLEKFYKKCGK